MELMDWPQRSRSGACAELTRLFLDEIQQLRPHVVNGQCIESRALLSDSEIVNSHSDDVTQCRTLLASLCAQVHGAAATPSPTPRTCGRRAGRPSTIPRVLADGTLASTQLHGAPIGSALDFLSIVLADVASMSNVAPIGCSTRISFGLPPFLADQAVLIQDS